MPIMRIARLLLAATQRLGRVDLPEVREALVSSWTQHDTRNVMMLEEVLHRFGKKLGRCPFCKSDHVGLYMGPNPHVTCLQCGADGPLPRVRNRDDYYERHHFAIDKWNLAA